MGCGSSTGQQTARPGVERIRTSYEDSAHGPRSGHRSSRRSLQLENDIKNLPPEVTKGWDSIQGFDAHLLRTSTDRPLSALALHSLEDVLATLGYRNGGLCKFLHQVETAIQAQGAQIHEQRLYVFQFIKVLTSSKAQGVLAAFRCDHPRHCLALYLAALIFQLPQLSDHVTDRARNSIAGRNSRKKTDAQMERVLTFLTESALFACVPREDKAEIVHLVTGSLRALDPEAFKELQCRELTDFGTDPAYLTMQATMVVASFNHVFRKFRVHSSWCQSRVEELQGKTVSATMKAVFAFSSKDITHSRYAKAHAWFVDRVLTPFTDLWLRLLVGTPEAHPLLQQVKRVSKTYGMMTDTRTVIATSSTPVRERCAALATKGDVRASILSDDGSSHELLHSDMDAVMSICQIYGFVNLEELYVCRRKIVLESFALF